MSADAGRVYAVSDLHVSHQENRRVVDRIRPTSEHDWLIVAGDVAEKVIDIGATLQQLSDRFARVLWVPGNHELWTHAHDEVRLHGRHRYLHLVRLCRELGVTTPEDPYPVWTGPGGPVTIALLFLLYDYSWYPPGTTTKTQGLKYAYDTGVVCTDEFLLHPDPYPDRESWCAARVTESERRLSALAPGTPTVLVNHWPLVREPTDVLHHPEFAQWCGTTRTADWHVRFNARAAVYGHLHIPRTTHYDGVRFEEVSLGYPREWQRRGSPPHPLRQILPAPG